MATVRRNTGIQTLPDEFPSSLSLTITNRCNLRCRMCGQWSQEGYVRNRAACAAAGDGDDAGRVSLRAGELPVEVWARVINEAADHGVGSVLFRGGEPFVYSGTLELIALAKSRRMFVSIDTNGTLFSRLADQVVDSGVDHLTISMDGPEEIHDYVRGVEGTYARVRAGIEAIQAASARAGREVSLSLNFTISRYNVSGLGRMPEVARALGVTNIAIVPYYYFPRQVGEEYERVLKEELDTTGYSWIGFHHEDSGVDLEEFTRQLRIYREELGDDLVDVPYLPLTEEEYGVWFGNPTGIVGEPACMNPLRLVDIQPDGSCNFCVDFPDYVFGNVKEAPLSELWHNDRARRFREYRASRMLPVCYRCGSKYMSTFGRE